MAILELEDLRPKFFTFRVFLRWHVYSSFSFFTIYRYFLAMFSNKIFVSVFQIFLFSMRLSTKCNICLLCYITCVARNKSIKTL